ncbi:MAG: FAD-binding oxidoreductase [Bacteroidia bacterium]|nr:FAD-binding oxidoreductase [Bacteroidia bacterium]
MPSSPSNISFWEKQFTSNSDIIIVGAGIVGLQCATQLKLKFKHRKVWVLDSSPLSLGASMRNAGFACFGSVGEILDDAQRTSWDAALALYDRRFKGISLLLQNYGETRIGYEKTGGFEVFTEDNTDGFERVLNSISEINKGLKDITNTETFQMKSMAFSGMKVLPSGVFTALEGAIQTHLLYASIRQKAIEVGVEIFSGLQISHFEPQALGWKLYTAEGYQFHCKKLVFCTNAFTSQLLPELDVQPARGQVLVTNHIPDLKWRGLMHADKGYYYFRSLGTRILIGGARNSDFETENTTEIATNAHITNRLIAFLKDIVIPNQNFEITDSWSGIMGMANDKSPIVTEHKANLYVCARMGGMGVALSSLVSAELADLVD